MKTKQSEKQKKPLELAEQQLVEQNLGLVRKVIRRYIKINEHIIGLNYEDLYQDGCVALCKAAQTYNGAASFSTYASTVVRNYLVSRCRAIVSRNAHESPPDDYENWTKMLEHTVCEDEQEISSVNYFRLLEYLQVECCPLELEGIKAVKLRMAGYSGKEIGKQLGISEKVVSKRIALVRKKIEKESELLAA